MVGTERPPRHAGVDAVLVIGLVGIVVGHVWSIEPVIRWTHSWNVPLFFMLGGYHWVANPSFRQDLRARFLSIGRPYLFWWVVVGAVYVVWEQFWGLGHIPLNRIAWAAWGGIGATRPWTAFWMFSVFFIAILIVSVSMRAGWWWTLAFAYAGLIISHVEPDVAKIAPLGLVSAMACTGFVLLGIGLREAQRHLSRPVVAGLGGVALGILGILLPAYRPPEIQASDFGTPFLTIAVAALIGSGLILLGNAAGSRIPTALGRVVSVVARCTVAVVLSHGIVLFLLQTPHDGGWRDFLLVLLLPMTFAVVTLRSRWAPWIHGGQDFSYRGSSHNQFHRAMPRPDAGL